MGCSNSVPHPPYFSTADKVVIMKEGAPNSYPPKSWMNIHLFIDGHMGTWKRKLTSDDPLPFQLKQRLRQEEWSFFVSDVLKSLPKLDWVCHNTVVTVSHCTLALDGFSSPLKRVLDDHPFS